MLRPAASRDRPSNAEKLGFRRGVGRLSGIRAGFGRRGFVARSRSGSASPGFAAAAGAGAAGSGFGASLCWLRKAITFARSCGLPRPAKVILVPGANAFGLVSHCARLSKFQVPPFLASASEKAKPWPWPIGSPSTSHRFGPSWLAPPLSALWQAAHFLKISAPLAAIGAGEVELDRLLGGGGAFAFLLDARDRIAHLFGALAVEQLAGNDRRAERDDAREQHPAGDGVEAIVHGFSLWSRSREGWICAAF